MPAQIPSIPSETNSWQLPEYAQDTLLGTKGDDIFFGAAGNDIGAISANHHVLARTVFKNVSASPSTQQIAAIATIWLVITEI